MPEPTNPQDPQAKPSGAAPGSAGSPAGSGEAPGAAASKAAGQADQPTAPVPPAGPPTQPLPASHTAYAAGPPPPGKPGMWKQATSTTGGLIAVILAGGLAIVLLLGLLGTGLFVATRLVAHDRGERIEQAGEPREDVPPGLRKKLEQQAPGPRADGPGRGGGMGNGMGQLMRGAMALGNVQHGEFTVTDELGKAVVMTVQRGEVTKVSDTSISVKSADNFAGTYAMSADTRGRPGNLAVGDSVFVVAEKTGAKAVLVTAIRRG